MGGNAVRDARPVDRYLRVVVVLVEYAKVVQSEDKSKRDCLFLLKGERFFTAYIYK